MRTSFLAMMIARKPRRFAVLALVVLSMAPQGACRQDSTPDLVAKRAAALGPASRPSTAPGPKGGTKLNTTPEDSAGLPAVSVQLLGPIDTFTFPRYEWPLGRDHRPRGTIGVGDPHELAIKLPGGRTLRHFSKATFFTQENGTVYVAEVMPLDELVPYQEAIRSLETLLREWDVRIEDEWRVRLEEWKTYGDLLPSEVLVNYAGWAKIAGEDKAELRFHIRPSEGGWFLSVGVGANAVERRKLLQADTRPSTTKSTGDPCRP